MFRTLVALLFLTISYALGTPPAYAQTDVLTVYLGGSPTPISVSGAPGSTVAIPVLVTGTTGTVADEAVEITVPAPLRTLNTSSCTAETVAATANAVITMRPCQIIGWEGPDGAQIISVQVDDLPSFSGFRIEATLIIEIPASASVGSAYTLSAPNKYFAAYMPPSQLTITVVSGTATKSPTPTVVAPTPSISGDLHDIDGSALEIRVGSIRPFSFGISYDVYPEATSASLTLYVDTGIIDVADPSVIDWDAAYICGDGDPEPPNSTSTSTRPLDALPTAFSLSLPRWQEAGTEVRVCAEVVYFNGSEELGTERYRSVITYRD